MVHLEYAYTLGFLNTLLNIIKDLDINRFLDLFIYNSYYFKRCSRSVSWGHVMLITVCKTGVLVKYGYYMFQRGGPTDQHSHPQSKS